jgi:hypothetical protein
MPGSYAARQPPAEKGEKPVTVLVTGFGVSEQLHDGSYIGTRTSDIWRFFFG